MTRVTGANLDDFFENDEARRARHEAKAKAFRECLESLNELRDEDRENILLALCSFYRVEP